MEVKETQRGFSYIDFEDYLNPRTKRKLILQSSAIGEYRDSLDKPGSSFLWVGDCHLDREEVTELIGHLKKWVETGEL